MEWATTSTTTSLVVVPRMTGELNVVGGAVKDSIHNSEPSTIVRETLEEVPIA